MPPAPSTPSRRYLPFKMLPIRASARAAASFPLLIAPHYIPQPIFSLPLTFAIPRTMRMFGLTGGIASGKSTVAARLAARGVPVLDADAFAREVVEPETRGLAEIRDAFGEGVILPDGSLDRKALAAIVFVDEARRKRLNAITHPRIAE